MNVITNPYTGDAVESVPFLTQDEAVGALTSLAEEQKAWAAKPLVERIAAVQAGATFIEENVAAIAAAMTATVGILCWKSAPTVLYRHPERRPPQSEPWGGPGRCLTVGAPVQGRPFGRTTRAPPFPTQVGKPIGQSKGEIEMGVGKMRTLCEQVRGWEGSRLRGLGGGSIGCDAAWAVRARAGGSGAGAGGL